jgi:hypothetical protein
MIPEISELDAWMREVFPVRGGNAEMAFVSSALVDDRFRVTMQLLVYDTHDGRDMVRDIKEQELYFCEKMDAEPKERVQALVQAWATLLAKVLSDLGDGVDVLMPHDLAPGDAIRLARSRTREDFEQALRAKGRLGKFIKS